MKKVLNLIGSPYALLIGLAVMLLCLFYLFPRDEQINHDLIPVEAEFDSLYFYSARDALDMAALYSEEEKSHFIRTRWTLDLLFPVFYGLFLLSAYALALKKLTFRHKNRFLILPLITVISDLLENIMGTLLLASGPPYSKVLASLLSLVSGAKWVSGIPLFLALLALIILSLLRKKISKKHRA